MVQLILITIKMIVIVIVFQYDGFCGCFVDILKAEPQSSDLKNKDADIIHLMKWMNLIKKTVMQIQM